MLHCLMMLLLRLLFLWWWFHLEALHNWGQQRSGSTVAAVQTVSLRTQRFTQRKRRRCRRMRLMCWRIFRRRRRRQGRGRYPAVQATAVTAVGRTESTDDSATVRAILAGKHFGIATERVAILWERCTLVTVEWMKLMMQVLQLLARWRLWLQNTTSGARIFNWRCCLHFDGDLGVWVVTGIQSVMYSWMKRSGHIICNMMFRAMIRKTKFTQSIIWNALWEQTKQYEDAHIYPKNVCTTRQRPVPQKRRQQTKLMSYGIQMCYNFWLPALLTH